jgi:hypothetical protein
MDMIVTRTSQDDACTTGSLQFGCFSCFTMEPSLACEDLVGAGRYEVVMKPTTVRGMERYREIPLVKVPGNDGIRIHIGNYPHDTTGCLLVGAQLTGPDFLSASTPTYEALTQRITTYLKSAKLFIVYRPLWCALPLPPGVGGNSGS